MRGDYMLSAVTRALTGRFGDSIQVYNERPAQHAPGEYLFVHQINREQAPDNSRFRNRFYFFDIRFHPDDKQGSQYHRMVDIAEELTECLALVDTNDRPVRASSLRSEVQDGILHFFADYPVRVLTQLSAGPTMESIATKQTLKE